MTIPIETLSDDDIKERLTICAQTLAARMTEMHELRTQIDGLHDKRYELIDILLRRLQAKHEAFGAVIEHLGSENETNAT